MREGVEVVEAAVLSMGWRGMDEMELLDESVVAAACELSSGTAVLRGPSSCRNTTGWSWSGRRERCWVSVKSKRLKFEGLLIGFLWESRVVELLRRLWGGNFPIREVSPRSKGLSDGGRWEMGRTRSCSTKA
jgi:hypothetical protein